MYSIQPVISDIPEAGNSPFILEQAICKIHLPKLIQENTCLDQTGLLAEVSEFQAMPWWRFSHQAATCTAPSAKTSGTTWAVGNFLAEPLNGQRIYLEHTVHIHIPNPHVYSTCFPVSSA
jgi:hypothetical protein